MMSESTETKPSSRASSSSSLANEKDSLHTISCHTTAAPEQASSSSTPVHVASTTTNGDRTQNGHMSPLDTTTATISNGLTPDQITVTSNLSYVPPTQGQNHQRQSPSHLHQPSPNHRGHSPSRFSPNTHSSRGNSPQNQSTTSNHANQQHVVHVHVNPGETFSVRVGDQIQHIQGPATVRMVSNNGPPLPMPMQVPPGHMVQQIVDENGILTHVILSPQPPGMPGPPMTAGGPNSTAPQQMYHAPYGPQYPAYSHSQYPSHHHPHGNPTHMHTMPTTPHIHGTPPPHQCNSHGHPHVHTQGPSSLHHNHPHVDERAQRQKQKPREKYARQKEAIYQNHIPPSPRRCRTTCKMNGDVRRADANSTSSSADGQELEEERRIIRELLSKMQFPKISDVESRSALIQLIPPECEHQDFDIDPSEFKYELHLSDRGKEGKYKLVYSGDATEITLKDLKPATEYHLRVSSILDDLKGEATEPVSFKTHTCEPDHPQPPKLTNRTKTSLLLKWNATADNGSKISSYLLEYDQGRGDGKFVEVYHGLPRQYKVTKLNASTGYVFRVAAVNAAGKSDFSEAVCFYTSGSAPSQPDPPMLSEQFVKALTISWIKRPNDDEFTLQMEDEATGHGFLTVYNGTDLSYTVQNLRRNTEYRFRLCANNDEGSSKWSDVVCYRTLPDRPAIPGKPQTKGKVHAKNFRVIWDCPKDNGGSDISKYLLEVDDGRGFEMVYDGAEREFTCDHLQPGHAYRLRVSCISAGGHSDCSEVLSVSTLPVAPGRCQAPKLQGKPRATSLHLRWNYPDYDGGTPVTEFEVQLSLPDNSTRECYRGRELDCTVAGLAPGRPYLFQVRAFNKCGVGAWSDSLEVVSGAGVPDPPKMPAAHCKSPHSAIISWEEPVNNGATITEYRLEWQQRADAEFSQLYCGGGVNFEVRGLTPATLYSFRVQAINSAGAGAFSTVATCVTPPSSPGPVMSLRAYPTANSIHVSWKEPNNNGSEILSYNIDIGEKHLVSVGNVLDHTIDDLLPETTYKIRVQAVNGIGVGAFGTVQKVTTRSLPPTPPKLECVSCGPNSLKLKWGDGKNAELLQYVLEMLKDNGSFSVVYNGSSLTHKVSKLVELSEYQFRIYATNEAGEGPYSPLYSFCTTKAPPPAVKAPKVFDVSLDACVVEWQACRPMGKDSIVYMLQIQTVYGKDLEYRQIYKGSDTSYKIVGLHSKTDYQVRVCAIRQCSDGNSDMMGAFSPGVPFVTQPPRLTEHHSSTSVLPAKIPEPKQLTDQQWAMIILLGFTVFAVIIAFLAQKIIAYTNSNSASGN